MSAAAAWADARVDRPEPPGESEPRVMRRPEWSDRAPLPTLIAAGPTGPSGHRAWERAARVQRLLSRGFLSRGSAYSKKVNGGWGHKMSRQKRAWEGGSPRPLLLIFLAHLHARPLDQVLTNRSGPRGAAPAGLS